MQTIKSERLARDLETMMNVVNSDPGHTARAKAKARKTRAERINRVHRRMIWMHTCLFLSGLFCGAAISAAVWSAIL